MPKISIIIPIYKVEKYIVECAKSLFEQTLDDIEYIFVNDCTPDSSMDKLYEVIDLYPKRKEQVKIINHRTNLGAAIARKNGILSATGEYIIHCDSDDWVDREMYSKLYNKAHQDNLDIVICQYYEKYDTSSKIITHFLGENPKSKIISTPLYCSLCNKLIKKDILPSQNIHYPKYHMMEDAVLCVQYFLFAERIGYLNEPLYYYRINSDSVCHVSTEESYIKRWSEAYANVQIIEDFLKTYKLERIYKNELIQSKANVRGFLMPLMRENSKHYRLWINTFPELNYQYIFSKGAPFSLKLIFFVTLLRLYPFFCKIKNIIKLKD